MTISFRTRLFVMAALIVGTVLAVVLTLGWTSLLRNEIDRLDERLCMEARRLATQPPLAEDPRRLEADVRLRLRLPSSDDLQLRLERGDGTVLLQSARWNPALAAQALDWRPSPRPEAGPPPREGLERRGWDRGPPDREGPPPRDRGPPPRVACELAGFIQAGAQWRAARFATPRSRSFVAADTAATKAELQGDLQRALTVIVPLALLLTALGAWLLSSLTMRPVDRLRTAMHGVTRQALDQRLASRGEDREFKELIAAYNTMLERLQTSFQQATRFSADAAHELKTPLTILQGRLEQAVHQSERSAIQADLTDMLEEVGRLAAITRKLLLLAQADAGRLALHLERVDLAELLDTLVADARMLASAQRVSSEIEAGLATQGDALLLRQLCNNLLSNAVRYCRPDGWITVIGHGRQGGVEVIFANASAPIGAEHRARFFDRFHRGDSVHGRAVDGHGLGLSLSREIARAHGGELTLMESKADEVRLRLWLPGR